MEDANDNAPEFSSLSYHVLVPENTAPNTLIYNVSATDRDSGIFGQIKYYLKGFEANKFKTNLHKGGIYTSTYNLGTESKKKTNKFDMLNEGKLGKLQLISLLLLLLLQITKLKNLTR